MTETRAEEAQRLVDEGGVHIVFGREYVIEGRVGSNEEGRAYHTFLYPNGLHSCSCTWSQIRGPAYDLCVHALALRLAVEKEEVR